MLTCCTDSLFVCHIIFYPIATLILYPFAAITLYPFATLTLYHTNSLLLFTHMNLPMKNAFRDIYLFPNDITWYVS